MTPALFFMRKYPFLVLVLLFSFVLYIQQSVAQGPKRAAPSDLSSPVARALHLADSGRCKEAIPLLKRALPQTSDKDLKRTAGLDGVRCAMTTNQFDAAEDFFPVILKCSTPRFTPIQTSQPEHRSNWPHRPRTQRKRTNLMPSP